MIVSEADAEKNKLDTGTLTWSDIKNKSEYDSSTTGANFNSGPGTAPKDKGVTPNFGGSSDKETSVTGSGIFEGTIITRDEDEQKQDVDKLNRNPDGKNQALDKPASKDIVLEKEQAAAIFGEIGFTLVGDIIQKNKWDKDDPRSIALHSVIGGLMAEINGGKFGDGLTTATINKLIISKLDEIDKKESLGFPPGFFQWLSVGLGSLTDSAQGAGIAGNATKNNNDGHYILASGGGEILTGTKAVFRVEADGEYYYFVAYSAGGGASLFPADLGAGKVLIPGNHSGDEVIKIVTGSSISTNSTGGVASSVSIGKGGIVVFVGGGTNVGVSVELGYAFYLGKGTSGAVRAAQATLPIQGEINLLSDGITNGIKSVVEKLWK